MPCPARCIDCTCAALTINNSQHHAPLDCLLCPASQATADGSLPVLVQKLRSQPQILTAYARDAPLRQPATADKLVAVLQQLQVRIP